MLLHRSLVGKNSSKQTPANNLKLREKVKNVPLDNPTVGTEVPLLPGTLKSFQFFLHPLPKYYCQSWWQGWPSGESTCLPPMWSGFDFRTRRHTWIEFVGSLLCYERFSPGYSGFPLSPKTNI